MTTLCLYVGGAFESKKDLGMGLNGLAERFVTGQRGLATHTHIHIFRHPQVQDRVDCIRVFWNPAFQIMCYFTRSSCFDKAHTVSIVLAIGGVSHHASPLHQFSSTSCKSIHD